MADLSNISIKEAIEGYRKGEFSPIDLVKHYLKNIEDKNPDINAYLKTFDSCLAEAEESALRYENGEPLSDIDGVPIAIKDAIAVSGEITSSASKILENYEATYDATVIAKLKKAGAILIGHTNQDEFAMGTSSENSAFGPVKNPLDPSRVAGGSSGGSAAALASDMCLSALGSDTGGSIRLPASFCGVVGLSPTYGSVSRFGIIALASSLDQIGPITKSVEDSEMIFDIIKGRDEKDSTTEEYRVPREIKEKLVIGVPTDMELDGVDEEVVANYKESISRLKELGYEIKDIVLPYSKYGIACYYIIMPAEASANLARYDGVRYGLAIKGDNLLESYRETRGQGFGTEVRRRIILGTYVLSAGYKDEYYYKANQVRALIREDFNRAFGEVDLIVMPTTATPAFKLGEKISDPLSMYLQDLFTIPNKLAGLPSISVPSGKSKEGLPFGIQFIAPHFREDLMFRVGKDFQA